MANIAERIAKLKAKGVNLFSKEENIGFKAAKGVLTEEDIAFLKANKCDVLAQIKKDEVTLKDLMDDFAGRDSFESFKMTDIQQAYMTGRNNIEYGGISCKIFIEFKYDEVLDKDKFQKVWEEIIDRHDMLHAAYYHDGSQQVRKHYDKFKTDFYDLTDCGKKDGEDRLKEIRENYINKEFDLTKDFPLTVSLVNFKNYSLMQFNIEFIAADWGSIWMILSEFEDIYFNGTAYKKPECSFKQYVEAYNAYQKTTAYEVDKLYWKDKIKNLNSAPTLPVLEEDVSKKPEFERLNFNISKDEYEKFKDFAAAYGVTPTAAVITAYAKTLERWSEDPHFSLNLTVLNRQDVHPDIHKMVGDFTNTDILDVDLRGGKKFCEYAKTVGEVLFEDLEHKLFSGVEVIREYAKEYGSKNALMPYVFTSAIGLTQTPIKGRMTEASISSTPQVFIDCQAMDGEFGLNINWDIRKGILPDDLIQEMFAAFKQLIKDLAKEGVAWEDSEKIPLPARDIKIIGEANNTKCKLKSHLLHEDVLKACDKFPEKIAVSQGDKAYTYLEIKRYAAAIAAKLQYEGLKKNEKVAVILPKSPEQVCAVIGILGAGGVYVPIDGEAAPKRRDEIIKNCEINKIITSKSLNCTFSENATVIYVNDLSQQDNTEALNVKVDINDPAYIIHTSGSTGRPKGVVISHKGAVNTIEDINERFKVDENDTAIGLSNLWFDLSVYDIFGILSKGGSIVYPEMERYTDPSHWNELVVNKNITIWNSVPAFMKMYVNFIGQKSVKDEKFPRLVMLSGDWICLKLFPGIKKNYKDTRCISLGGATEASIWSNYFEFEKLNPKWKSIPYGKPLSNQFFKVLDSEMRQCPIYVRGELYIGGSGLAIEYLNNKEANEKSFVTDPTTGERLYKTGDYGRYLSDGNIEFMGRKDFQVKVHGYRIELGEIKNALSEVKGVKDCLPVASGPKGNLAIYALVADSDGADKVQAENPEKEKEIKIIISEKLPSYMIPKRIFFVDKIPLSANGKADSSKADEMIQKFLADTKEKTVKNAEAEEKDEVVKKIEKVWCLALGLDYIDKEADLYELGADSLIMGEAAGEISKEFDEKIAFNDILIQMLNFPRIGDLADYIKETL